MNIMLIDDDPECLESLNSALRLNGFNVRSFDSPEQAIIEYDPGNIDVVITDYHFPVVKGTEILKEIHRKKPHTPVIIITADQEKDIETVSLEAGAYAFFRKPLNIEAIIAKMMAIIHS
jgi:DNA-binding response OmpR family regulator